MREQLRNTSQLTSFLSCPAYNSFHCPRRQTARLSHHSERASYARLLVFGSLTDCVAVLNHSPERRSEQLDSLDWSKKYEVLSISRLVLCDLGFTHEQIVSLTDEEMQGSREITLSLPSLDNFWFAHRRTPDGDGQTARSSDGYKSLKAVLSHATLPP
jgi:hypothetical protein